jgi:TP901 family phage tail tape measure protein
MPRTAGLTIQLNNYTAFREELRTLDRVIADLDQRIDTVGGSFDKLDKSLDNTERGTDEFEKEFKNASTTVKNETKNIDDGISRLSRTAQTLESIGTRVAIGISAPAAALKAFAASAAIEFESSFAGVVKTLDTTNLSAEETTAVLAELRQGIRDLATDVNSPLAGLENAHNELARIAELGSQLGVAKEGLLEFTETIGLLAMTSDMTADAGATNIAQFANIMQSTDFDRIGATIVDLGNKSAATESQIIEFGQRIAGAGAQAGFSEADVLGLGAAMASVGLNAEAGGTAITRVLNEMISATANFETGTVSAASRIAAIEGDLSTLQHERLLILRDLESAQDRLNRATNVSSRNSALTALERETAALAQIDAQIGTLNGSITALDGVTSVTFSNASEQLELFAAVAGVSAEEFATAFTEDAAGAVEMFVTGLSEMSSGDLLTSLEDLGFTDVRVADTLRRLAQAPELLAASLDTASEAFENNTALTEEAQKRFETTAAQINLLKNNITDLAISLGDAMLPGINRGIDVLVTFIQAFQDASPAAFQFTAAVLGIAAAAGPVLLFAAQLVKAFEILSITISLPAWYVIAGAIAAVGLVIYDLKNNIGGAADELAAIGTNFAALFSVISEIGTGIIGVFQFIIDLMPLAERSFSPVAAALGFINDQITNLTSGLSRVRDFLTLFNAAQGNFPVAPGTESDEERNRLLEERYRLLDDITRLEEEGLETQTAALTVQVESGDTLWDIARANNTTVEELMRLNNLDTNILQIGQELTIAAGASQSTADEMQRLSQELAAVDEQLRALPAGVQAGFDAFAETPLFDRIFGTDEGARDRALETLIGIRAEAEDIQVAVGGIAVGFMELFAGNFDEGMESIRSGFSDIGSSIRDIFAYFNNAGPERDTPLVALTGDMGGESGSDMFAGLGESITSGLEAIANGDYSGIQTMLENNLVSIFTLVATTLGNMFFPPLGIFFGLAAKAVDALELDFSGISTLLEQSTIFQSIQDGFASLFGGGGDSFMLAGDETMFGMTGGASADGMFAPIIQGFENFVATIQPIITSIELVWEGSLRPAFETLITGVGDFVTRFMDALDVEQMQSLTDGLSGVVHTIVAAISTLILWIGFSTGPIVAGIGSMLGDLGAALGEFINIVTSALSGDFLGAGLAIYSFVSNLASAIGSFVTGSADSIIGFLETLTGMDFASADEVIQSIQNLADMTIGEGIRTLHEFITNIVTGNFENTALGRFLAGLPDMFGNAFRAIGREIGILIDTFMLKWQMVQALLPGGGEGDAAALQETEQRIQSARVMQGAFGAIGAEGLNLNVPISFEIEGQQFSDTLAGWLNTPGILDAASEDSRLFIEQAMTAAAESADVSSFYTILNAAMQGGITGEQIDIAGMTETLLANLDADALGESTATVGESIATGLAQGITDNETIATDAMTLLATDTQMALIDAYGVHSPSLWMQDFALSLVEGLQVGFSENLPLLNEVFGTLSQQFIAGTAPITIALDSIIAQEAKTIELVRILGMTWLQYSQSISASINRIRDTVTEMMPKLAAFIQLMDELPNLGVIKLVGMSPGAPPPNTAYGSAETRASGGPGVAGGLYRVAEPSIGGIEMLHQDGGGTYIVSGRDFMAVPPSPLSMAAPVGSLPIPPTATGSGNFGGSSIIFEQPVVIENPSGGPVTPDTIAAGMQQWQRQNPPRRQLRDSL